jgi:flagellar M-ring protein FliF
MDPSQIKYVQDLQESVVKRIESIITPIVGPNNVRAEATADVDFSRSEQAVESYKPNQTPDAMVVRSQQTSESLNGTANPGGVPGALTNQPPAPATAPINAPGKTAATTAAAPSTSTHKDSTVNYEVDKTIQYVQQGSGGLKRLSVAVVVNYKKATDENGAVSMKPLSDAEKTQITNLVKEAMGFNQERGDTLNVVNSPFASVEQEAIPDLPLWKQPWVLNLAMQAGKYLLMAVALIVLYLRMLKPMIKKISEAPPIFPPSPSLSHAANAMPSLPGQRNYQENLTRAQSLASQDPRVVANIVKTWVGTNE